MPSSVEIAKALFVIFATGAIIAIGWRENWFKHKAGVLGVFVAFWIMATTAFPMPAPPAWQIAVTLIVLSICAIFAFWEPAGKIEVGVAQLAQTAQGKEEGNEEVEYVPVADPGDTITGWVPQ